MDYGRELGKSWKKPTGTVKGRKKERNTIHDTRNPTRERPRKATEGYRKLPGPFCASGGQSLRGREAEGRVVLFCFSPRRLLFCFCFLIIKCRVFLFFCGCFGLVWLVREMQGP